MPRRWRRSTRGGHFSSGGPFEQRGPQRGVAASTRDLMSGDHPTFEVLHRWSDERGYLMQAIAGIFYYHRRFGYEMAVSMSAGRRVYVRDVAGKLSSGDGDEGFPRPYRLRLALASDAPLLSDLHRRGRGRYLLTSSRDEGLWRYEVVGRDPESDESLEVGIVEDAAGRSVGYVCHTRDLREGALQVDGYELTNDVSWLEVTPFVLSELAEIGRKRASGGEKLAALTFVLGEHHPLHEAIPEPPLYRLDRHDHYSFYVRVPDLSRFLRHVAPVLERRLPASVAAGHTGELKVSFYGGGLRLPRAGARTAERGGGLERHGRGGRRRGFFGPDIPATPLRVPLPRRARPRLRGLFAGRGGMHESCSKPCSPGVPPVFGPFAEVSYPREVTRAYLKPCRSLATRSRRRERGLPSPALWLTARAVRR
jgi:hypothetical protein